MKDYKRLTKRCGDIVNYAKPLQSNFIGAIYEEQKERDSEIMSRLAELEDKIESGELCDGAELEQVIKARDEYKHRAEVAERALRNAAPRLKCRGGLGEGFCGVDKCDYYHCNNDEGCVKAHLQQAEKELAEEGKDD